MILIGIFALLAELDIFLILPSPPFQHFVPFTTDWARLEGELSALFIGVKL